MNEMHNKMQGEMLDVLCPMHVVLGQTGQILHAGPTLIKLFSGERLIGRPFFDAFEIKRPRHVQSMEELLSKTGSKLHLKLRTASQTALKGVVVPGMMPGTLVIDLSFGIAIASVIQEFNLTSADFAPTDLTIEMLYLIEAKSAAMDALRKLNGNLQTTMTEVEEQAQTDALTGLKNRRAMDDHLIHRIKMDQAFAVMQVDLDYFKAVNDTLGHAAGDHVLRQVAQIMTEVTRGEDIVARVGGDEFVILLPGVGTADVIENIGTRLIAELEKPIPFDKDICKISGSIGVAFYAPGCGLDMDRLMDDVDVALYASKRGGRGRQTFYSKELR